MVSTLRFDFSFKVIVGLGLEMYFESSRDGSHLFLFCFFWQFLEIMFRNINSLICNIQMVDRCQKYAGNKQMIVGKRQPPTGHLPVGPVTLFSQWRIKITKRTYLNGGSSKEPRGQVAGREQTNSKKWQSFSKQTPRVNPHGSESNAQLQSNHLVANITMIIDNLV